MMLASDNDTQDFFSTLQDRDVEPSAGLRERLVRDAEAAGLLDVAYRTVDTPVGPLLLASTRGGLIRVAFEREGHDAVLEKLAADVSPRILRAAATLEPIARQIDEYFSGRRHTFDVPLDFRLAQGFRLTVLQHLCEIQYGQTASYAVVASWAGNPKSTRAVGSACAHNPLPVVVPCHRVVRSDGSIGEYLGGVDAKRILLNLEAPA